MADSELMTIRETSVYLRCSDTTVRKARRAGVLRPFHLGSRVLYVRRDLDQLIANGGITAVELADLARATSVEVPQRDADGYGDTSTPPTT